MSEILKMNLSVKLKLFVRFMNNMILQIMFVAYVLNIVSEILSLSSFAPSKQIVLISRNMKLYIMVAIPVLKIT